MLDVFVDSFEAVDTAERPGAAPVGDARSG